MQPYPGRKEDSVNLVLINKGKIWTKYDAFGCNEPRHYKRDCPKSDKNKRKWGEAHILDVREKLDAKKSKKEEARDIY